MGQPEPEARAFDMLNRALAARRRRDQHRRDLVTTAITAFSLGALWMARVLRR
jgi:hypothetical protein